jgi:hypothetical protein
MKKFFLFLFILFDLSVIVVSVMFLITKLNPAISIPWISSLKSKTAGAAQSSATTSVSGNESTDVSSPTLNPIQAAGARPASATARQILFKYRSSKPKKVMIRADFTGWRAESMTKNAANQTWEFTAALEPGEYSYLFSVDDRPVRDPANKRTKKVGTTVVSSLVVAPLAGVPK